jgi:hypothetical protein
MARHLTNEEIEILASKPGVKRIAVENFLGSLQSNSYAADVANMQMDAGMYRWNAQTVSAITKGINVAYGYDTMRVKKKRKMLRKK